MSKRHWIIATAVGIAAVWIGVGSLAVNYSRERQEIANRYDSVAQRGIQSCREEADLLAVLECTIEAVGTAHVEYSTFQVLAAQQHMSQWALAGALISTVTLITTVIGIYYLRLTLRKTAEANNAASVAATAAVKANQIMREQQRPWVKTRFEPACRETRSGPTFEMRCYVKNIGGRPALMHTCDFAKCTDFNTFRARADSRVASHTKRKFNGERGVWPLFPNEEAYVTSLGIDVESHGSPLVEIEAFVFYGDTGDEEWMYTVETSEFLLHAKDDGKAVAECISLDEVDCVSAPHYLAVKRVR